MSLENVQLKREKGMIENDLLKTQVKTHEHIFFNLYSNFSPKSIVFNVCGHVLIPSQASLKKSQFQADQVETLTAENTKIINMQVSSVCVCGRGLFFFYEKNSFVKVTMVVTGFMMLFSSFTERKTLTQKSRCWKVGFTKRF